MKKIIALFVVIIVVIAGWTAGWFYVAGEVRRNIELLAEADGVASPKLTCAHLDVWGFPFRFDVTCSGAVLKQADLTLDTAEVRASVLVYAPTHAQVLFQSPLKISDAFSGASSELRWADMRASVRLGGWNIERVSLVGNSLDWVDTITGENPLATATHVEAHLLDKAAARNAEAHTQTLDGFLRIDNLVAPAAQITAGNMTMTTELSGLPEDIRTYGDAPGLPQRIAAAGGELKLVALDAKDGDTSLAATGGFKLDAQQRPEGQLVLTGKQVYERVGTLIPEPMKTLVFGQKAADGSYTQTLDIRQGVIFAGLVPLGVVPPLM